MSQKGIVLFVVMHVNRPYTALKRHTNRQNRQNWRKRWRYQGKIVTLSVNLFSTSSNEAQHNKTVLFYTRKKYDFTLRSVRGLISYFFTPEKSTILPFVRDFNRTFSHPKKVRFYPSLRARPHIVLFHTRKKYDFTPGYLCLVHILIPKGLIFEVRYQKTGNFDTKGHFYGVKYQNAGTEQLLSIYWAVTDQLLSIYWAFTKQLLCHPSSPSTAICQNSFIFTHKKLPGYSIIYLCI